MAACGLNVSPFFIIRQINIKPARKLKFLKVQRENPNLSNFPPLYKDFKPSWTKEENQMNSQTKIADNENFKFSPILLSCGHVVQLMAATFRQYKKCSTAIKHFPLENHKSRQEVI